jgi:hypothetical protein
MLGNFHGWIGSWQPYFFIADARERGKFVPRPPAFLRLPLICPGFKTYQPDGLKMGAGASCVAHTATLAVRQGLINANEKGSFVRNAARKGPIP